MSQKKLRDHLIGAGMRLSWTIRSHPARFLFTDGLFKRLARTDAEEAALLQRRWLKTGTGSIWDVGASLGKFTCDIARANPNCRVYAFEPNLNSLYFLAHRTARFPNVEIVPAALTVEGRDMKGSYSPDFTSAPTGPLVPTYSLAEALQKFGRPVFIKMDIESEEFKIFTQQQELLKGIHMLVEWHTFLTGEPIPPLKYWRSTEISPGHTFLEPLP
jgi:FkbM family methyltransferase